MNELTPEINIEASGFEQLSKLESWIKMAFELVAKQDGLLQTPNGDIGLLLTTDLKIQRLNKDFRDQNKSTNVLSFPADADDFSDLFTKDQLPPYLGDIAMAYETLKREADTQNKTMKAHFIHLLIHSILHLLGYDHLDDKQANEMENLEIKLLSMINIENPYQ